MAVENWPVSWFFCKLLKCIAIWYRSMRITQMAHGLAIALLLLTLAVPAEA
jgi:hypothetical protein